MDNVTELFTRRSKSVTSGTKWLGVRRQDAGLGRRIFGLIYSKDVIGISSGQEKSTDRNR